MIDPNWQIIDLDPVTWRQIGRFFDPGQYLRAAQSGEHGLFVLHEQGYVQRIVDSKTGVRRDICSGRIDNIEKYAQQLYERGEWERVHVIEKSHLAQVARLAQETPQRELTLDQYYHYVYQLIWSNPIGYMSIPPHPGHWHGWTYQYLKDVISNLAISPASLALGVFVEERLQIGLILLCEHGQIRKVTTFEALHPESFAAGLSNETLIVLEKHLEEKIAPPAGILLCSQEVFERWIHQEEKMQVLLAAQEQEQAYWRWTARNGDRPS